MFYGTFSFKRRGVYKTEKVLGAVFIGEKTSIRARRLFSRYRFNIHVYL